MFTKLTALLAVILTAALLLPAPAAAQSGAVKPGQNKVPIRTIVDDVKTVETAGANGRRATVKDDPADATAKVHRNNLSSETTMIIIAAAITTISIIASVRGRRRVCGPLSGCPLF